MSEPDFDGYTEEQLRQVLTRIDAVRFPERVMKVKTHLAALAMELPREEVETDTNSGPAVATVAGLWRRLFAFSIDMIILGVIGMLAGWFLSEQLAALGAWGRLIGFLIALAYFGMTESYLGDGRSLGMRVLGLKVVTRTGEMLSVPAALARAAIFCLAYFLNGAEVHLGFVGEWGAMVIYMFVLGLVFSVFYMLVFNGRTRQSVHDLAVDAFVVKVDTGNVSLSAAPIWRGHSVVIGTVLCALFAGSIWFSQTASKSETFADMTRLKDDIVVLPGINGVGIFLATNTANGVTKNFLRIDVVVDSATTDRKALAQRIAISALDNYAAANDQQSIVVNLISGFDIGIASLSRSDKYEHSPEEWRAIAKPV